MTQKIKNIINRLKKLDVAAAQYVEQRYNENTLSSDYADDECAITYLFAWSDTPQGWMYWRNLYFRYMELYNNPIKTTPLGNEL